MASLTSLTSNIPPGLLNAPVLISAGVAGVAFYLVAVSRARYRTVNALQKRFGSTPEEFKNLHYSDAQMIAGNLYFFEAPWIFLLSHYYAILTAFGLEPISKLSARAIANTGLRFSNTISLSAEWLVNPLDSDRSSTSINRVNYIHSRYKGIENGPMLYTLCCLLCKTPEWVDRFGYRETVPLEKHAVFVFWREVGIRFGITESSIPDSFEGCQKFIKEYEEKEMRNNEYSVKVAQSVLETYQATVPKFLRPIYNNIFVYLLDEPAREAFGLKLDTSSLIVGTAANWIFPLALKIRSAFIRHCLLPRSSPPSAFEPAPDGVHTYATIWQLMPYFVEATWWNTWGPWALVRRAFGLPMPGGQYKSEGYTLQAIGYGEKGGEKVLEVVDKRKRGECPFSTFGRIENEPEIGGVYAKYHAAGGVIPPS